MLADLKRFYDFTWHELWEGVPFRVLLSFYFEMPRLRYSERLEAVLAVHGDPEKHIKSLVATIEKLSGVKREKKGMSMREIDAQLARYSRMKGRKGGRIGTRKKDTP